MQETTEAKHNDTLAARGFTIESSEAKAGETMLDYSITIKKDGREVITTDYHIGIGHVDLKFRMPRYGSGSLTEEETSMFEAWQSKPYANFKDKALQMRVAVKLAKQAELDNNKQRKVKASYARTKTIHDSRISGADRSDAQTIAGPDDRQTHLRVRVHLHKQVNRIRRRRLPAMLAGTSRSLHQRRGGSAMIIDNPYIFFLCFFVFTLTLGAWMGYSVQAWRVAWLKYRIDTLKLALKLHVGRFGR